MDRSNNWQRLAAPVPERLREARLSKGLSIVELAEVIGVSRQAISQFELGHTVPSAEVFRKMIEVLDFPLSFFSNPTKNYAPAGATFFRKLTSATKKSRDMLLVRAGWLEDIYLYLNEFINFPTVNLPKLKTNDHLELEEIEELARQVRKELGVGLGPINNLILVLEKHGIVVSRATFSDQRTDACSQWRGDRPFIFLSNDKESAVRSRFDAAHELAHLLLHMWVDHSQLIDPKSLKKIEMEAHHFASAFLMPEDTFGQEVLSTSLEHFLTLKRRWKVSIQAMIMRCRDLGILSENQYSYLFRQINFRKWKTREPFDDILVPEFPSILRQGVKMLIDNGVQSPADILDALKLPQHEIEQLCNLPEGMLASEGKVIPLNLKRSKT
ncbi:XRE family transcriptional regulator [Desulforamulus aquiferis]|uniref:XRE family transcriptional regulator n=1 Tax=Desulforamulus aquiferis TaxID=1397668 RepID=A0AAW7ZFC7_9FIRM|nr:XRE family transcriptional regulator [Desulforamulus aquiferis]MDO7787874.1 XRE family transcriptional regulator [Desulforamulus aquiferis]